VMRPKCAEDIKIARVLDYDNIRAEHLFKGFFTRNVEQFKLKQALMLDQQYNNVDNEKHQMSPYGGLDDDIDDLGLGAFGDLNTLNLDADGARLSEDEANENDRIETDTAQNINKLKKYMKESFIDKILQNEGSASQGNESKSLDLIGVFGKTIDSYRHQGVNLDPRMCFMTMLHLANEHSILLKNENDRLTATSIGNYLIN